MSIMRIPHLWLSSSKDLLFRHETPTSPTLISRFYRTRGSTHGTAKFHAAEFVGGGEGEMGGKVECCRSGGPHSRAGLKFESHGTR